MRELTILYCTIISRISSFKSHHAHISGGIVGTLAGYYIHKKKAEAKVENVAAKWLSGIRDKAAAVTGRGEAKKSK